MHDVDIMIIGHFAKDRLVVDGVGQIACGAAAYYGSVALRRFGIRVALVTRLHRDDFPLLNELKQEGVQVFATAAPETTGIENFYDSADMERRAYKPLGFAGPIRQEDIPNLSAQVYLVSGIIHGEVEPSLLRWLATQRPVALDVQGFIRFRENDSLVLRQWSTMSEDLACVTYLKADRSEAEFLTGETDLASAARQLAACGPREIIVTQTSGVTVYADGHIYEAPFTPRSVDGRTGRGDTCFATYVGKRLSAPVGEACRFAAAVPTLKQEERGPWRGTLDEVEPLLTGSRGKEAK
jgi:sugar/nucleoside kinase (ribokinase family)